MSVNTKMTAIADEVRTLSGATDKLGLDKMASHTREANTEVSEQAEMIQQLKSILQGKAEGGTPTPTQEKTVEITTNGPHEVTPDDGYVLAKVTANVNVPIPDGYVIPAGSVTITENGEHNVAGKAVAKVSVPIPDGYIKPSGELEISENGPHDVTEYASVNVNVESGGDVARSIINKTINAYSDNEITTVGDYAFNGCSKMTSVNLPNATSVGTDAFNGCSALTDINVTNAKTVSAGAFQNCTSLIRLDLPQATVLNGYLVSGCSSLVELNIPNATSGRGYAIAGSKIEHLYLPKFASAGSSVFRNATYLRTVDMPLLNKVEQYLFTNCSALENVTFPKATSVASQAMENCYALAYADLPICKSIAAKGFYKCSSLETLILRRTTNVCALANVSAFTGTPIASGTGFIYVPSALVDSYKSATNWSTFASQFRAIEDYPDITGG